MCPNKKSYIQEKNNNGEIYLFKILNKDFKKKNKNTKKDIHTLYFNALFSKENLEKKEVLLRLAGNAEIFYRQKSLSPEIELRGSNKQKEVIKYKRYTEDKILFHFSIKINALYNKIANIKNFNDSVNKLLKEKINEINVIGIDRGEKNLLYYTVINQRGEILEHGSLNEINGVNYFEKLIEKEKERKLQRQSWFPLLK